MRVVSPSYSATGSRHPYVVPFGLSFTGHLLLLALVIYTPSLERSPSFMPSVIDVQMVDLSDIGSAAPQTRAESPEPAPEVETAKPDKPSAPKAEAESAAKPEISVSPPRKSTKKAMKYKTFKSKKVIKNVIKRVEQKVDTLPPKPLEDTIKRLRDKVAKEGKPAPKATGVDSDAEAKGKDGFFARGGKEEAEAVNLYQLEIAYQINKNWAYSDQMADLNRDSVAKIAFKVLPNGQIEDIFFTQRSGSKYLDDSGYKAIVKSSPVKPHPPGLNMPYVLMGISLSPEGVK